MELDYRNLRALGNEPRVHGNGFIQLDLDNTRRAHFWGHPRIPRQVRPTPIHDHVFGFTSRLVKGSMANVTYLSFPHLNGFYDVYEAQGRKGSDTVLQKTTGRINLRIFSIQRLGLDETTEYYMPPLQFHETIVGEPTITVITKTEVSPNAIPRVLSPNGIPPDNDFDRHSFSSDMLWEIIEQMVRDLR